MGQVTHVNKSCRPYDMPVEGQRRGGMIDGGKVKWSVLAQ